MIFKTSEKSIIFWFHGKNSNNDDYKVDCLSCNDQVLFSHSADKNSQSVLKLWGSIRSNHAITRNVLGWLHYYLND